MATYKAVGNSPGCYLTVWPEDLWIPDFAGMANIQKSMHGYLG